MARPRRTRSNIRAIEDITLESDRMEIDSHGPSTYQTKCGCRCGCACCQTYVQLDRNKHNIQPGTSSPIRGRSPTPKHDRTNGNGNRKPIPSRPSPKPNTLSPPDTNSSIQGEEGLATHQIEPNRTIEIGDLGAHAPTSIQNWLSQHTTPQQSYHFPSNSPQASMIVESSTTAPSLASSGFLPARSMVGSAGELVLFADGGFDEGGVFERGRECAFTPLWLGHEVRYCRGLGFGEMGVGGSGYPVVLEVEMEMDR